ncbi:right-handed parallel beta-helix repeat-containing protein [Haloferula sp. BvORR071]|uniref:right-handed parallel beta-helix repeat-containing protein n=1 Tax=Haloferula sp. BvORR071 TaxID=1396141 RepID=UPI00054EB9E6|nr:right-handed parallel beta-helix repeat-containing protein [Haloferula sp. BvORR071]
MKTLDQVEPRIPVNATNTAADASSAFVISQPGSYYLPGNVTATGKANGISIQATGVTLDLSGYKVSGASSAALSVASGAQATVRNGWLDASGSSSGIRALGTLVAEDLQINGSSGNAVYAESPASLRRCQVFQAALGVNLAGGSSLIADCVIRDITQGPAVVFRGTGSDLRDSTISNIDLTAPYTQGVDLGGSAHRVVGNRIGPVGGRGILITGTSHEIRDNHIVVVPSGPALDADSQRVLFRNNTYENPGGSGGIIGGTDGGGNAPLLSSTTNTTPTAVLTAPNTVGYAQPVNLSGIQSSDAEGDRLTYNWSITERPAAGASISGSGISVSIPSTPAAPLAPGQYRIRLTVTDSQGLTSAPADSVVQVLPQELPTAVLDRTTTAPGPNEVCVLTGARSSATAPASIASYSFTLTSRPNGSSRPLNTPVQQSTPIFNGFTPDVVGTYRWQLVVRDSNGGDSLASLLDIVVPANGIPTAVLDQSTTSPRVNQACMLSAARSSDTAPGSLASYTFTLLTRPAGSTRPLNTPVQQTGNTYSFTPDVAGSYQWRLVVRDNVGNDSAAAILNVLVTN